MYEKISLKLEQLIKILFEQNIFKDVTEYIHYRIFNLFLPVLDYSILRMSSQP
jgi:hypothetical protein